MKKKLLSMAVGLATALTGVVPFSSLTSVSAEDSVIFSSDFEDGSISDWTPFGGGGKLALDTSVSHSGNNSLIITDRSEAYHGPSISGDTMFKQEKTYNFTAWAYQKSDSEKTLLWTLKYTDGLGQTQFTQIAGADLPADQWTELNGSITIPEDAESCLMYFECANATVDFYIDDVSIVGERANQEERGVDSEGYLYSFDFEIGTELWSPRGDNRLIRTDEEFYTGSHSIYVTNRTKTWNGPTVGINDVKRGVSYYYSAYIKYIGDEYEDSHNFRMELQYNSNGETVYQLIKEMTVKKGQWTHISGTYTLPQEATDPAFYIQTANLEDEDTVTENDLMSFYTDTVTICETSNIHKQTAVKALIIFAAVLVLLLIIRAAAIKLVKSKKNRDEVLKSASKDAMTQCLNRNAYEKYLGILEKNPEKCKSVFFTLCDVNFLKYINDNLGHEKGDEAITRCGKLLMEVVGNDGDVFRTGGDEFVCITNCDIQDKVRGAIARNSGEKDGYPFFVASGFAHYDTSVDAEIPDVKAIVERCDKNMYQNKQEIKARNADYSRK